MCDPMISRNQNEIPAIQMWNPQYSTGAKNKNVNSRGSVIPVKNEVIAAAPITENATCLFSFLAAIIIAAPAAGNPNNMNGNLPCMYCPGLTPVVKQKLATSCDTLLASKYVVPSGTVIVQKSPETPGSSVTPDASANPSADPPLVWKIDGKMLNGIPCAWNANQMFWLPAAT